MNYKHFWLAYGISTLLTLFSGFYVLYSSVPFWSIPFFCAFMVLVLYFVEAYIVVKPHQNKSNVDSTYP